MKSITRQTCYKMKVNSTTMIIVNQRYRKQDVRKHKEYKDKPELRRRSQEIKNPENNALQFLLYPRTTRITPQS